jgi:hypothetical protein
MVAYLRLEPYEGKLSRTVLRRERAEQSALTQPTFFSYSGGVAGVSPVEGGNGKALGFGAWGKAFPLLIAI